MTTNMADEEPVQTEAPEAPATTEEPAAEEAAQENKTEEPAAAEQTEEAKPEGAPEEQPETAATDQPAAEAPAEAPTETSEDAPAATQETTEVTEGETVPADAGEAAPQAEGEQSAEQGADGEGEKQENAEETAGDAEVKPEGEEKAEGEGEGEQAPVEGGEEQAGEQAGEGEETAEPTADAVEGEEQGDKTPLPDSNTFEDGQRPESPVAVGEKLSREGTPTEDKPLQEDETEQRAQSPPVPGTPDGEGSIVQGDAEENDEEEEEDEEEYDDEPQYDREMLISKYHQALTERHQLQDQNYQLQHKLAEHFRKKKADERQDVDKNVTDQEQRYLKYMANLDELRRQDTEEREMFKQQIEDMHLRCEEKKDHVNEERQRFMEFKRQIALNAVNSRSGKPIPERDVDQYMVNESRKEEEVVKVRLENIKLKNKLRKKEQQLKSKEELAEGLHMIDFEQLKIENQTYNEKIEERNEELLKLRKKITSTVQELTHLKEKLQFVQGENGTLNVRLKDVEEHAAKKRDILSRTKQARDGLRIDNQRLRQNAGLLGNEPLLRDFEERKDEGDDLKVKLDQLKMQHAELTLNLNGVRRKIEQAKQGRM